MSNDEDVSAFFLESSRFWIQRVFVPFLVFIGVGGNVVTIMVLTRRRMRCTTHIYLTALALADLVYLLFVLVLSFEHYPNIHNRNYVLYWRFYGITHWLCDAASSTSVWLTVSFTIERYIIVCHPLHGKVLCTEGRAKNIITVISLLCLLTTASTTFEYQLVSKEHCVQEKCDRGEKDVHRKCNELSRLELNSRNDTNLTNVDIDAGIYEKHSNFTGTKEETRYVKCLKQNGIDGTSEDKLLKISFPKTRDDLDEETAKNTSYIDDSRESETNTTENATCCVVRYKINIEPTELGKNVTYTSIFYWFSSIGFGLLPLVMIAAFNCFLVKAVFKSTKDRSAITNSTESSKQRHENRITTLLIGIVILFLICQTPTASFLIYDALDGQSDRVTSNIKLALGNIFNFLLTLNASCNFLMYCVLSKNYRRTLRSVFCTRKLSRQETAAFSVNRSNRNNGFRRNQSEYRTPRNLETQSLTSIPRSKSLITRPMGKARSTDLNV